jgi:hypothetical protein
LSVGNLTDGTSAAQGGERHQPQVPFLGQPFYAGPLVSSLGGADIRARQGLPAADPVAS